MKVAILTAFRKHDDAYSLCHVVLNLCRMLRRHNISYMHFAEKGYSVPSWCYDIAPVLAKSKPHHYEPWEHEREDFEDQAEVCLNGDDTGIGYKQALAGFDTVITHDLATSPWHLPQNKAIRDLANVTGLRWFHWVHSPDTTRPDYIRYPSQFRYDPIPGAVYVLPGFSLAEGFSKAHRSAPVAVVHNPYDVRHFYNFTQETCDLIDLCDLFEHDICQAYAFSTPGWKHKGVEHLLRLFGKFKNDQRRVKLVLVNSHVNSHTGPCIKKMHEFAVECGLEVGRDYFLTSELGDAIGQDWSEATPWPVVRDLTLLSNIAIFPSDFECCSLIQAEAAIAGKLLVLNGSLKASLEFPGTETISYKFQDHDPRKDDLFYEEAARRLMHHIDAFCQPFRTKTLAQNETYNMDWIWQKQLYPLLTGNTEE